MKTELLTQILASEAGARRESDGSFVIADDWELTLLLDMGQEALQITRIRRLTFKGELLLLETHKGERVYTSANGQVRAVKITQSDTSKLRGTGFTAR